MKDKIEFNAASYRQRTGIPINQDAVIAVSRSFDAVKEINRAKEARSVGKLLLYPTNPSIASEHLLVGVSRDRGLEPHLLELGFDAKAVSDAIVNYEAPSGRTGRKIIDWDSDYNAFFDRMHDSADQALVRAAEEARQLKASEVGVGHILLATCYEPRPKFEHIVASLGVGVEKVKEHVVAKLTGQQSPYGSHAEYVAQNRVGQIPTSLELITAYMKDPNIDAEQRAQLIRGFDSIARRLNLPGS